MRIKILTEESLEDVIKATAGGIIDETIKDALDNLELDGYYTAEEINRLLEQKTAAVAQNGGLHGSGTAADPLGVNDLTRDELIDILDKTGFPTAFLKG